MFPSLRSVVLDTTDARTLRDDRLATTSALIASHVAVAALAFPLGSARKRGTGRLDGIDRVRLAGAPAGLAVRPVDFDHLHASASQKPR